MRLVDPIAEPRWDERLLAREDASIFHTAAWARVLRDSYGYRCCYLAKTDGDQLSFLLPLMDVRSMLTGRRGVSLPFTDFCEPLTAGHVSPAAVVREIVGLARERRWKYVEVRGGEGLFGEAQPAVTVLSHSLDLEAPEEALFAGVKESTRRNIRKARREGVTVRIGTSADMLVDFYRLNCLTRRKHGLPPQPLSFFRNVQKHLLEQGFGCVVLAFLKGRSIGGAVYLHFGRDVLYKYGASDPRFLELRPNDVVMWEAIRWYHTRGSRRLGFGRTELQHEGLRRYKLAWGVEERSKAYYRYDLKAGGFREMALKVPGPSAALFRRLPGALSRAIGTALYRHVA